MLSIIFNSIGIIILIVLAVKFVSSLELSAKLMLSGILIIILAVVYNGLNVFFATAH